MSDENPTQDELKARRDEALKSNEAMLKELGEYGAGPNPIFALNQRIDSLLAVMVPDDARVYVDIHYHEAMHEYLQQMVTSIAAAKEEYESDQRKQALLDGLGGSGAKAGKGGVPKLFKPGS